MVVPRAEGKEAQMVGPGLHRVVCIWELRRRFNALDLDERVRLGEARALVRRSALAPGSANQPAGTRSEIVEYWAQGQRVAVCHRYVLPDRSIGGSGVPDPKWLMVDGVVLIGHASRVTCSECEVLRPIVVRDS
jgi:hypothetical protein